MSWKHWLIFSGLASLLISIWVTSGVQTTMIDRQNKAIHTALDEVEKDIGSYDPDSSRNLTAPARAIKVARKQAELAAEKEAEMRALIEQANQTESQSLADTVAKDSTGDIRYFDEYGRPLH